MMKAFCDLCGDEVSNDRPWVSVTVPAMVGARAVPSVQYQQVCRDCVCRLAQAISACITDIRETA